jgi:hypothetical protein
LYIKSVCIFLLVIGKSNFTLSIMSSSSSRRTLFPCLEDGLNGSSRKLSLDGARSKSPGLTDLDLDSTDNVMSPRSFRSRARGFFSCFSDGKEKDTIRRASSTDKDNHISTAVRARRGTPSPAPPLPPSSPPPSSVTIAISESPSPPHVRPPAAGLPPLSEASKSSKDVNGIAKDERNSNRSTVSSKNNITYNRVYCNEFNEEYESIQYLMKIPANAKPGQRIVNVGGLKDCSVNVPEYIYPGETIVLMVNGLKKKRITSTGSTASTDSRVSIGSSLSSSSLSAEYYAGTAKMLSRVPSNLGMESVESALSPADV